MVGCVHADFALKFEPRLPEKAQRAWRFLFSPFGTPQSPGKPVPPPAGAVGQQSLASRAVDPFVAQRGRVCVVRTIGTVVSVKYLPESLPDSLGLATPCHPFFGVPIPDRSAEPPHATPRPPGQGIIRKTTWPWYWLNIRGG